MVRTLSDDQLDKMHTVGCATMAWPSDPWYDEKCNCLVAEVRRLRDGIREHREAVCAELTCCDDCRAAGKEPSHTSAHDAALWKLLDDQEGLCPDHSGKAGR